MNLNELLATTPEHLASLQYDSLQSATVEHLRKIADLIEQGQIEEVSDMVAHSPAGDGYGYDNDFIDFTHIWDCGDPSGTDIGNIIEKLTDLSS